MVHTNLLNSFQGMFANNVINVNILMWCGLYVLCIVQMEMQMDLLFPKQKLDSYHWRTKVFVLISFLYLR